MKIKRLYKKLNYIKLKPFKIIKKILPINFRLKLPLHIYLYLVFHIVLLKTVLKNTKIDNLKVLREEKEYKVADLLDNKEVNS